VSAQASAFVGVVIGALLAGGANLLLAWRGETIQARAGVILIRKILTEALDEVGRLRRSKEPRWRPEMLPDSKLWDQYRAPVSARLSLATLKKIDIAMRRLDQLNHSAERASEVRIRRDEFGLRAVERRDRNAAKKVMSAPSPLLLTPAMREGLESTEEKLSEALEVLDRVAPSGEAGKTRNLRAFPPWFRWHWRSFAATAIAILLIGGIVAYTAWPHTSTAARVQHALADHFQSAAFVGCDAVHDEEGDYSCLVARAAPPASCGTKVAAPARGPERVLAKEQSRGADDGCDLVDEFFEYEGKTLQEDDCVTLYETGASSSPRADAESRPGFMRRMWRKLRHEQPSDRGLPPVIVPGTAFTANC
jgi:hypothetical protein